MIHSLRFIAPACAGLVLAVTLPATSAAQLGGNINLHTGPVAWDQTDSRDPLLEGHADVGYYLPAVLGLRPELHGDMGASSAPAERYAFGWNLGARLHTGGVSGGVWLGATIGSGGIGSLRTQVTRVEGGFRKSLGPARINVSISRTGFGAGVAPGSGLTQDSTGTPDTLARKGVTDHTDVGSQVTLGLRRYEVGLSLIQRLGARPIRRTAWELSATWWVVPSVGVVGATGHSLPEFGFTVPGARYSTVGLRLALGGKSPTGGTRDTADEVKSSAGPTVVVVDRLLTIRWAPAGRAEVMGDFTDWKAEPLTSLGQGRWTLPVALPPGLYHLNVRFDGGAWLVPSGAVVVDDGFGGRVGLVVVR